MTSKIKKGETVARLSLKDAFEVEHARRELERRSRAEAERRQQEEDLASAERLYDALAADPEFLASHKLTVARRRYTVSLDHQDFRLAAYFEAGKASVTAADKRSTLTGSAAPRKQESAETVEDALALLAKFLADETR